MLAEILFFLILRYVYDIAIAAWTFLPFYEPCLEASCMENVVTNRNFHKFFALSKVLQAKPTLLLLNHVWNVARVVWVFN